ncbi:lipopolysaccharide assembly protein LapB [Erythrobacter sp. QSSC1-22B]|uniref:tetratricopeptide repeat protein n=1 Tax=Erythrobacter sp. QSSC1-22B TaxID=1860125 RepID=UPI00143B2F1C|nr:tetratricopeptide repeat protein [Erythrobacter sp. QSSC1-22B]
MLADFRVTGRVESLEIARREYSLVQSLAPEPAGAPLALADFALATHDIAAAKSALVVFSRSAVPPTPIERSEAFAMHSDIAFYKADLAAAHQRLAQAEGLAAGSGIHIRQALLLRSTGEFDGALTRLAHASTSTSRTPLTLASIALQAGVIESSRGNYAKARNWYETAERLFPGYWLTRLHLAEARLVAGEDVQAIAELESIVEQSPRPEAMDMLALIYRVKGQRAKSLEWSRRASAIWRQRVAEFPNAYGAHAAEHELVFGDPNRALALAIQNRRARPYGEARILLANTLIANGQPEIALDELIAAEASGWRSATLYAAKAQASDLLGHTDNAETYREQAISLNPEIFAARTRMVWLAHG